MLQVNNLYVGGRKKLEIPVCLAFISVALPSLICHMFTLRSWPLTRTNSRSVAFRAWAVCFRPGSETARRFG